MIIKSFEDIMVWNKAKEFVVLVYKHFYNIKDYSFRDQIQRAFVSIMNNIAEGFERQTNKEFRNFLFISKGSCGEVRSMLSLAFDLKYITLKDKEILSEKSVEISKMLSGFIKTL